jgi:hypothetical protein
MSTQTEILTPADETHTEEKSESCTLRVITWFSVGMAVAALGIYVGHELRSRYKFKNRTPYDYYSNAGEHEFGVGV